MNPNTKNSRRSTFSRFQQAADKSETFWEESAILGFTEEVLRHMEACGVSKAELARRLNVDPAYVTKLMGGSNNFTLKTMVKIARTLDAKLRFQLQPKHTRSEWSDYRPVQPAGTSAVIVPLNDFAVSDGFSEVEELEQHTLEVTFPNGPSTGTN